MSEIRFSGYVAVIGANSVEISPSPHDNQPDDLNVTKITLATAASTPSTAFFGTAATCHLFDVIVRRKG